MTDEELAIKVKETMALLAELVAEQSRRLGLRDNELLTAAQYAAESGYHASGLRSKISKLGRSATIGRTRVLRRSEWIALTGKKHAKQAHHG